MERRATRTDSRAEPSSTNIWIPHELLQNANSEIYNYNRRNTVQDERETQTLSQILEQPAQAILATDRRFSTAPGRLSIDRVSSDGRASPTTTRTLQRRWTNRRSIRANSYNSISFRQHEQEQTQAEPPVLIEYSRPRLDTRATIDSVAHPPPARLASRTIAPPAELIRTNTSQTSGRPQESDPPIHQVGRVSIQRGASIPYDQLRLGSYVPEPETPSGRRPTFQEPTNASILRKASVAVGNAISSILPKTRQSSIAGTYERAKIRQQELQRSKPVQIGFQYFMYFVLICFVYFVMIGRPLWGGMVW